VLGFSRRDILWSFLVESILYAIFGAALACALVLPLTGKTTGIGNFNTGGELDFDFRLTPRIAL
jgi:ABC-type antimicrobial peptide transport system permease subunit